MYKIFVGDKPIVLTTLVEKETNFKNYLLKSVKMAKVIRKLNRTSLSDLLEKLKKKRELKI